MGQCESYPYIKDIKFGHSDISTGRMSFEGKDKEWGDASKSQGIPKISSKPLETRGRGMGQIL